MASPPEAQLRSVWRLSLMWATWWKSADRCLHTILVAQVLSESGRLFELVSSLAAAAL